MFSYLSFLYLIFLAAHPYHISVCDIVHKSDQKTLQVSQRVFLDDLEETLNERFNIMVDVTNPKDPGYRDSLIQVYLFENINITVDGKTKKRNYIGNEIEEDGMWCYIEYLGVKTMVRHLRGEKVPVRIDTGSILVTKENLGQPEIHELLNPDLSKWLK